jgi:hypothetical protein
MKILLDECITKKLKTHLQEYGVFTVTELQWSGIKNGKLMPLCIDNGFDILLTIDKNFDKYSLSIVVINSQTSKIEELISFLPSFKAQVSTFGKT